MAKVTITIEDMDTSIGEVSTSLEADPMPTGRFMTQAHALGATLYVLIPELMIKVTRREESNG